MCLSRESNPRHAPYWAGLQKFWLQKFFAVVIPKLVPRVRFELTELLLLREPTLPICPPGLIYYKYFMTYQIVTKSGKIITPIHIPKTAGISIREWVRDVCKQDPENYSCNKFARTHKHYGYKELKTIYSNLGFCFAVVRNPWSRAVSMYTFLTTVFPVIFNNNPDIDYWGFDLSFIDSDFTFKRFLERLNEWPCSFINGYNYASPQVHWIDQSVHVIRFESLQNDFKLVQDYTGTFVPLKHLNKSARTDYKFYYTDNLKNLVKQYFIEDIETFSYLF